MASNVLFSKADNIELTAPTGGVSSGQLIQIGSFVGVAAAKADAGDKFTLYTRGIYELPKRSPADQEEIAEGTALYLDSDGGAGSTPALSKVATGNGNVVAIATESASSTSTTVVAKIRGNAV